MDPTRIEDEGPFFTELSTEKRVWASRGPIFVWSIVFYGIYTLET